MMHDHDKEQIHDHDVSTNPQEGCNIYTNLKKKVSLSLYLRKA